MDKNLKKIKYQELFLSELRNSYFGEKKLKDTLREMETEENMKKLTKALKSIWKRTDEDVENLKKAFSDSENKEAAVKPVFDKPIENESLKVESENKKTISNEEKPTVKRVIKAKSLSEEIKDYQILTYENLVELVDNLDIEQISEILQAASDPAISNHQYLTKVAEKLVQERNSRN